MMQKKYVRSNGGVLPVLLAVAVSVAGVAAAQHWGYHGDDAPAEWCGLDQAFNLCCEGDSQTPIDISTLGAEAASLPEITLSYNVADVVAKNNGHAVQIDYPEGVASLTVDGTQYDLLQFHFHTPSEHFLDGEEFDMEMHLVHQSADGTLLVLGVFIEPGAANTELNKIWNVLPTEEGDMENIASFDVNALLPNSLASYRYNGSLTTPPCTEGVNWIVLANSLTLSASQINTFKAIFSGEDFPDGNRRPLKPRNGRIVVTDAKTVDPTGGCFADPRGAVAAGNAGVLLAAALVLGVFAQRRKER